MHEFFCADALFRWANKRMRLKVRISSHRDFIDLLSSGEDFLEKGQIDFHFRTCSKEVIQ